MNTQGIIESLSAGDFSTAVLREALTAGGETQQAMFSLARARRHEHFPDDQVQVRSVIEISNVCRQQCLYCAIGGKSQRKNYTLDGKTIVALVDYLYEKGRRTVLLQSGENPERSFVDDVAAAVGEIHRRHADLRIILCMGDLPEADYQMLHDAGARYPWADNDQSGSLSLPFEAVLERGGEADVWMLRYSSDHDLTYDELLADYHGYSQLKAFRHREVYGCNVELSSFYEDTPFHPERLLSDFLQILHPDIIGLPPLRYYKKVKGN